MNNILIHLEKNSKLTNDQLARLTGYTEKQVKEKIEQYEKDQTIVGYPTLINWDNTDRQYVTALIEIKVNPQKDIGFDKVAEKIYSYPEVSTLYLMSGGFDLAVIIEGKTLKDVAMFVASKLSTIDSVVSTATHFVLKKYKEKGILFEENCKDERGLTGV